MALVSPYRVGDSPREKVQNKYVQPTFQAGTKAGQVTGYKEPGFPAQAGLEQLLGDFEGLVKGVDIAARTPAYTYERPAAAISTVASELFGTPDPETGQKSDPLNDLTKSIPRVPGIADAIDAASGLTQNLFHYTQGIQRSYDAKTALKVWDAPGGERPEIGTRIAANWLTPWSIFDDSQTNAELREGLKAKGWTDEDVRAMQSGEKALWDFPEKRWIGGEGGWAVADFAASALLDPTNLVFGVGFLTKSAKGADAIARSMKYFADYARVGSKAAKAGMTNTRFAETMVGGLMTKGDDALRLYRNKVAIPTTVGQVGMNTVSQLFPEVKDSPIGGLFELAEKVGDNKPLSQNDLFMIASMLNFPARQIAAKPYKVAKNKALGPAGVALERKMIEVLTPDMAPKLGRASDWTARKKAAMKVVGVTEEMDWRDMAAQVMRAAVNDKYSLLNISGRNVIDEFKNPNLQGLMLQASQMQKRVGALLKREFEEGLVKPADVERVMKDMVHKRGGMVERATGGLQDQVFTPEAFGQYWQEFSTIGRQIAETFGGQGSPLVPAIQDKFVTVEGVQWMRYRVHDLMDQHGDLIPARLVKEILMDEPAVFRASKSVEVAKVLSRNTDTVDGKAIMKDLKKVMDEDAFLIEEVFAPANEAMLASAERAQQHTSNVNRLMDDPQVRTRQTPEYGQAEAVVYDTTWTGSRTGVGQHTDQIRAMRADPRVAGAEFTLGQGLRESGLPVTSAVQVGAVDGKVATSALSIRVDGSIDRGALETIAALSANRTKAGRVMVIRRGENELLRHGEVANAVEFVWDPGRKLTVEELNEMTHLLRQRFGDRTIVNDTTGVMRVIVRDDNPIDNIHEYLDVVTKKVGSEPTQQAVNVQDIVRKGKTRDGYTLPLADATANASTTRQYWSARRAIQRLDRSDVGGPDGLPSVGREGGPAGQPPGRGGSGAYRDGDTRFLTRYEASVGNTVRGSEPVFARPPTDIGEFRGRAEAAIGRKPRIPSDSRIFQLPGGEAGGWVTPDGVAYLWRVAKPGRSIDTEWNGLLAEVSQHSVLTRVVAKSRPGGNTVDVWGDHGWRVVGATRRNGDDVVTLLRDVKGDSGLPEIPPRMYGQGGYQALRENNSVTKFRSYQQADANAYGLVQRLYPDGLDDFLPAVETEALAIVEKHTLREIEEMAVESPATLALLRARQIARTRNGGTVESGGAIIAKDMPYGGGHSPEMIAKMQEAGFVWDEVDGWVHFDNLSPATTPGEWYYHGTMSTFDESIRKAGMRPGNLNGNWTKNMEDAEKFTMKFGDPIYRTKVPGGKAVSDKVQAGGLVKPDDMQVSYDGGTTWTDVSEVNKFYADKAALSEARKAHQKMLADNYTGDAATDDLGKLQENIEGWQGAKSDFLEEGMQGQYDYEGVVIQNRDLTTATNEGTRFRSDNYTNEAIESILAKGLIGEGADGVYHWKKYFDYDYAIYNKDGDLMGSFKLGVKDGPEATIFDSAAAGGKETYHKAAYRSIVINDFGGRTTINRDMVHDFLLKVEEEIGEEVADALRIQPEIKAIMGEPPKGGRIATTAEDYKKIVPPSQDSWLSEYSAGGSRELNTPLRQEKPLIGKYAARSEEALLELDRATHLGAYPHDDFITWRGVGEKRYGDFSEEYVEFLMNLKAGDDIIDKAYWSTTSSAEVASRHYFAGDPTAPIRRVVFVIHNREGQRMAWMHHLGNEAEILAPRNSSYHVLKDPEITYPGGKPPTMEWEFAITPEDAKLLRIELEHAKGQAMNNHGFLPQEVEWNIDLAMDALDAPTAQGTVIVTDPGAIEEVRNILHRTASTMRKEINDPFNTPGLFGDEWQARVDRWSDELDRFDADFVPNQGTDIRIELENLGDDPWVDPDALQGVIDDTLAQGGGTFEARYLKSHPAEEGGYAVATYMDEGRTSYKKLTGDAAKSREAIREAVEEVRYTFPDDPYVGTWYDDTGTLHIGPSRMLFDEDAAFDLARSKGQMTLWDMEAGGTYVTPNSFNMAKGRAFVRKSGKPRSHTQNARDFKRAIGKQQKQNGRMWDRRDDIIDDVESRLYMDDHGQAGALVAPDGRIEYFWSGKLDGVEDLATPIRQVLRDVHDEGIATHAKVPEYALGAAEDAGMVPIARVGDDYYMAWADDLKEGVTLDGAIPEMTSDAEAVAWVFQNSTLDAPKPWNLQRTVGLPWEEGAVKWAIDVEQDIANYVPRLDASLTDVMQEMTPVQRMKVHALQRELQQHNPKYYISKPPKEFVPYYQGQGKILDDIFDARSVLENHWYEGAVGATQAAMAKAFDPVYSRELGEAQKQEILTEFLEKGVNVEDAGKFIRKLGEEWETKTFAPWGLRFTRRPDMMNPQHVRAVAVETLGSEAVAAIRAGGDDVVDLLQRSGSRFYRSMAKRFPAHENGGRGALGGALDYFYGKGSVQWVPDNAVAGLRRGSWALRTGYHIWRFLLDPRWLFLNSFEPDILAFGRAGRGKRGFSKFLDRARGRNTDAAGANKVVGLHRGDHSARQFIDYDDLLMWDTAATGWLDPRNVNAYIGDVFDVERKATTQAALMQHIRLQDDVYEGMGRVFGEELTPAEWAQALDDKLMGFDTVGVEESVLAAAAADGLHMGQNALLDEFLTTMIVKNRQLYRDVMHTFHGNFNRSNIERLANSPLLWWPLSYQLKAGKWVFDMLTKRVGGAQTDLLGMGYFNFLLTKHNEKYQYDPEYKKMFDEHTWTWRALGMMIPMTPMDMGVYMARWTRYSSDWLAAQMGISERNPHYPQTLGDFLDRSVGLGPLFTADLLKYIGDEFNE